MEGKEDQIGRDTVLELLKQVDEYVPTPQRAVEKPFLMTIEGIYSITGRGTVVTGRVERGSVKKGQECEILGYGKQLKTVVTGLEMFKKTLDEGRAGDQLGALVRGIKREQLKRGMVLCKPGTFKTSNNFESQIYLLKKEEGGSMKPFLSTHRVQMFARTFDQRVEIVINGKDMMMPGEDSHCVLKVYLIKHF